MIILDNNTKCDYCGEPQLKEEFKECDQCDWLGHDQDCYVEHYLTSHDYLTFHEYNDDSSELDEEE